MSGSTEVSKGTMHDMTVGKPSKLIIQFMIPMFLGNVFQQFYNVADSIVAGKFLGVQALAAIGSTGSLMFFVTGWMNGMSSGFAILVSQWFGAKKYDRMRHYVAMSVYLSIILSVLMTAGFLAANVPILRLMNFSDDIMPDVTAYMGIIYAGLIVTAAYNALAAFSPGAGRFQISAVFSDHIGSDQCGPGYCIYHLWRNGCGRLRLRYSNSPGDFRAALLHLHSKKISDPSSEKGGFQNIFSVLGKALALGIPMALQFSITAIGTIIVQGAVNVYGEIYMAGFAAAGKLQNIIATVFSAFGATIATYVGQNRGAGKLDRVKQGVHCTQIMIIVYSVFAMILVLAAGKYMMWMFVSPSETEVIDVAVMYFRTVFWCYPFLGSIFLYRNTLQGLGYGLVPMLGGVFELIARAGIVLLVAGHTSFVGVCLSDPAAWLFALIPLVPYYIYTMRKWKKA